MNYKEQYGNVKTKYYNDYSTYFDDFEYEGDDESIYLKELKNLNKSIGVKVEYGKVDEAELKQLNDDQTERQGHGFTYQSIFCSRNNLVENVDYTAPYDAYSKIDKEPWSIKNPKNGCDVELGDVFLRSKVDSDFYMQVAFWENETSNIVSQHTVKIDKDFWLTCFDYELLDELKRWLTNEVSNDKSYDKEWEEKCSHYKKLWGDRPIRLRFKRDSKKQKRIQCAINNSYFFDKIIPTFGIEMITI
jgi:hypothetical protein